MAAEITPELIPVNDVALIVGISQRQVWRLASADRFPKPVSIPGLRKAVWRRRDLQEWLADLRPAAGASATADRLAIGRQNKRTKQASKVAG